MQAVATRPKQLVELSRQAQASTISKAEQVSSIYDDTALPTNPHYASRAFQIIGRACENRGIARQHREIAPVAQHVRSPVDQYGTLGSQDGSLVAARMRMLKGFKCQNGGNKQESFI